MKASTVISSLEGPNKKYLDIVGKLCDVKFNLNQVRVTEAFIDDIVEHWKDNISLPLCADVTGLINDRTIGHEYDPVNDEFHSQIIGGLYDFKKEGFGENASLVIGARVMKRYGAVCNALTRLFVENRLKFSFEITAGEFAQEEDGSITIDASPLNYLEGVAVVTFPACEDAIARELVAECLTKGDECDLNKDVIQDENKNAATEPEKMNAEENQAKPETKTDEAAVNAEQANAEQQNASENNQPAPSQTAEVKPAENEGKTKTAERTDDDHDDKDHDDDDDNKQMASENEPKPAAENVACDEKKNASEETSHVPDTARLIAELKNTVESMAMELASLKDSIASMKAEQTSEKQNASENVPHEEPKQINAEAKKPEDETSKWTLLNPFMASITVDDSKQWTLL